jgi:FkbH-like protein
MFQYDWHSRKLSKMESFVAPIGPSALIRTEVKKTMLLHWQEHCLECAPPSCYKSCTLFVERADKKCARLVYGISRNENFSGLFNVGADLRFRRWGKIETKLHPRAITVGLHRFIANTDLVVTAVVNSLSFLIKILSPFRRLNGALTVFRENLFKFTTLKGDIFDYDEFVLECYLAEVNQCRFLLEIWSGGELAFREALLLFPGKNYITRSASILLSKVDLKNSSMIVYPENDGELRVVFTWLDFVKYRANATSNAENNLKLNPSPATKVKCLAWDLDNTLWDGTLIETEANNLTLKKDVLNVIRRLDERGILQTVVSKNNFDAAWSVVERLGLADFFLFPAINWGSKSSNIIQIAKQLNIGVDTLALVDDSVFERSEVKAALPMTRVYPENDISGLLNLPEFNFPITVMSRLRRESYRTESKRNDAQALFSGDYIEFLRSCEISLRIFTPNSDSEILRCLELIQRSNQLNLSSRRYNAMEFTSLLGTKGVLSVAMECIDKFGSYGIVGFVSVDERVPSPCITNFVLSCRVAQKRVEHAFFCWLVNRERSRGYKKLLADLVVTSQNGPLVSVFDDLRFEQSTSSNHHSIMELNLDQAFQKQSIIKLTDSVAKV